MGRKNPTHLVVGHLTRPHGTRGEFLCGILTDHPESVFAPGVVLSLGGEDDNQPDPDLPPLRIESVRPFQRGVLVEFGGVDDRNQAELLRGRYLFRAAEELEPLAEGEVFYHQLLGMKVVTTSGEDVGEITEVFEMEPADLLQVQGDDRQVMVPFLEHIVVEVDPVSRRMVIDPPEGLLEL